MSLSVPLGAANNNKQRRRRGAEHELRGSLPAGAAGRRRLLGRAGPGRGLVPGPHPHSGHPAGRHPPLVRRRRAQHQLPGAGPSNRTGPRRAAGADPRFPGHRQPAALHLQPAKGPGGGTGRRPGAAGRGQGRRRGDLSAHGAGSGHRHARLRAAGRGAFGGVRRFRRPRAGDPRGRCQAQGGTDRLLRHRNRPGDSLHAAGQRRPGAGGAPGRGGAGAAAGRRPGGPDRHRLQGLAGGSHRQRAGGTGAGERRRPAVHHVHLRHHRETQGYRARQRRPRGGAAVRAAPGVRHARRGSLVGLLGRGLGGGPLVHRLRAAAGRLHHGDVRGQAGEDTGRRRLLAGGAGTRRAGPVRGAHRVPGDPQGRPGRRGVQALRREQPAASVRGRRKARHAHLSVAQRANRPAGLRPLVADRDRLAGDRALHRPGPDRGARRLHQPAGARLPGGGAGRQQPAAGARRGRRHRAAPAAAAGLRPDPVERPPALPGRLPEHPPRLLPHRRRRLSGRRRLRLHHGPHRRRD